MVSMKIVHVITRLIIGGAQENTVLTCRGLVERGHRVTLIAGPETGPEGSLWDEAKKSGCELIALEAMRRAVHPGKDWKALGELRRCFERISPEVVHTHSSKAGIVGRAAAVKAGVPVIIHTIHGMSFNRTQPVHQHLLYRWLERRVAKYTTRFITVADAMIEQAVTAGLAPRDRFTTVYSGMETEQFGPNPELRRRFRDEWGVAEDDVVVGTIARLFDHKGYEEILAAMPAAVTREPRLRFVWIGDGANRTRYEHQLARLGLRDHVHLVGLVHPREVASQINGFDIVLHASRWEGLPRALVQGLLTEVPAISFDNDGAPEVVHSGMTGYLVPLGSVNGLADAIVKLATDAPRRREMGMKGRAWCLDRFDWRRMVERVETLYTGPIKPNRGTSAQPADRWCKKACE